MDPPSESGSWQRILLAVLLVGGPAYLGYGYVYAPKAQALTSLEARVASIETQNRAAQVRSEDSREKDLRRRLAASSTQLMEIEALVPTSEELPDLLDAIATEALRTGVELALIQPVDELEDEFYTRPAYDLAALGAYHPMADFLARIGSLPRIVAPRGLQLRVHEEAGASRGTTLEARFRIETYVFPDSAPPQVAVKTSSASIASAREASDGVHYHRESYQYPIGDRPDPFHSLLLDGDLGIRIDELTLRGTVHHPDPSLSVAIITQDGVDQQIKARVGEHFGSLRVLAIHPDRVEILIDELGVARQETLYMVRSEPEPMP